MQMQIVKQTSWLAGLHQSLQNLLWVLIVVCGSEASVGHARARNRPLIYWNSASQPQRAKQYWDWNEITETTETETETETEKRTPSAECLVT